MSDNNNNNFNDLNNYYIKADEGQVIQPYEQNNRGRVLLVLSIVFSVIGFLFVCLKLLLESRSYSHNIFYNLGYAFGGLIFLSIIFIVFRKKKTPLLIFAVLYLLFSFTRLTASVGSFAANNVKSKAAQQKFVVMCNEVYKSGTITDETYDKAKYGDMAEFLTYMNGYFKRTLKLSNDMNSDMNSVDFESILKPETLNSVEKMNNAKKSLVASKKLFDKYEAGYNDLSSSITSDIKKMNISPMFKEGFISSFTKAQVEHNKRLSSFFNVERDIADKVNQILDFMISRNGRYGVENGQVLFDEDSDVDKYNSFLKELDELVEKEDKIMTEAQNSSKASLEKLNQLK